MRTVQCLRCIQPRDEYKHVSTTSLPGTSHTIWQHISACISARTGRRFTVETIRAVSGGCINRSAVLRDSTSSYFVKMNASQTLHMFEAEANGLQQLATANALRVPSPVCSGKADDFAWLVLEDLGSIGSGATADWSLLGRGLAKMHQCEQENYGWHCNNTIGTTPQNNSPSNDWVAFFRDRRIGYQLNLAFSNGYRKHLEARGNALLESIWHFFAGYKPQACLLHGDLWSGNVGFVADGTPVVFDPAIYYGDRETDIAMTELFGGFAASFYHAYETVWPLNKGYATRKHLYNLYHLLNHLNLFGDGYLSQCESTIDRLLAQVR